jgi:response regulator RpfG family c-di-GMP phosphodiesterase
MRNRKLHTPIIALGTPMNSDDHQAIIEAGANGFLAKPFDIPSMIATVQRYLPLVIDPLLEAEATLQQAKQPCRSDSESSWSDQIDEVKRAFASADYVGLEARTGALRRHALQRLPPAAADEVMRLQLAVRSGDDDRITVALERLDRIICTTPQAETVRRTQFQAC